MCFSRYSSRRAKLRHAQFGIIAFWEINPVIHQLRPNIISSRYFQEFASTVKREKILFPSKIEFPLQCGACQAKDWQKMGEWKQVLYCVVCIFRS